MGAKSKRPVVFVVGPTASGKSALALEWALQWGGGIFNADSLQIYQKLDIGTAKPSLAERQSCPHFLFDIAEVGSHWSVGDYCRRAWPELEPWRAQRPAFVVGGSGFYIQGLQKGLFPVQPLSEEVKAQLEELKALGNQALRARLEELDPEYAQSLSPQDFYRLERGLAVVLNEGRPMSQIRADFQKQPPALTGPSFQLGLHWPREILRQRAEQRLEEMLRQGWLEEVQSLLAEGWGGWPPLKSVGYAQCVSYLKGEIKSLQEAKTLIVTATLQLAKKQMTWFKRDRQIFWVDASSSEAMAKARSQVDTWLKGSGE